MIRQKHLFLKYEQVIRSKLMTGNFRLYTSTLTDVDYLRVCMMEEFAEFLRSSNLLSQIGECGDFLGDYHLYILKINGCIKKPKFINASVPLSDVFFAFVEDSCNDLRKRQEVNYLYSCELVSSYLLSYLTSILNCDFYQLSLFVHAISLLKFLGRMFKYDNLVYHHLKYDVLSKDLINLILSLEPNIFRSSTILISNFKSVIVKISKGEHIW